MKRREHEGEAYERGRAVGETVGRGKGFDDGLRASSVRQIALAQAVTLGGQGPEVEKNAELFLNFLIKPRPGQ